MAASPWASVPEVPSDPILGLTAKFKADPAPRKVNLAQGVYRTDEGNTFVLDCVRQAEARVLQSNDNKDYLPVEGNASFCELSVKFALGESSPAVREGRVAAVQSISGSGALRVAGEFLVRVGKKTEIWVPNPSWGNHKHTFTAAGLAVHDYAYLDAQGTGLDFDALAAALRTIPEGSAVLLHACAHNPTGVDPSVEQWKVIAGIFKAGCLIPIFDSAYQGYASGDPVADAAALRLFEAEGVAGMVICQSYAKSLGLYGERVGALAVVCSSAQEQRAVMSQIKQTVIRPMYSSPQLHGARLAATVLGDPALRDLWGKELIVMSGRLQRMRKQLADELRRIKAPGTWEHLEKQIGMFAFTGLTAQNVDALLERHHIYLTKDGRLSVASLFPADVAYVAAGIKDVLEKPTSRL